MRSGDIRIQQNVLFLANKNIKVLQQNKEAWKIDFPAHLPFITLILE